MSPFFNLCALWSERVCVQSLGCYCPQWAVGSKEDLPDKVFKAVAINRHLGNTGTRGSHAEEMVRQGLGSAHL